MSTTTIDPQHRVQWRVPKRLTESDVESWLAGLGVRPPGGATINVGNWRHTALFGDMRLFGALSWLRLHDVMPELDVPPDSLLEGTLDDGHTRTASENRLTGTVGGYAASLLCELDDRHRWWQGEARRRLDRDAGFLALGQESSFVEQVDKFPVVERSAPGGGAFNQRRGLTFARIQRVADALDISWLGRSREVKTFVLQAWENAEEHGSTTEHGYPIESLRILSIRWTELKALTGLCDPAAESGLHRYVAHMKGRVRGTAQEQTERLVEITVADGGIGIPARMARTSDVYAGSQDDERRLFTRAMQPGASSRAGGGPGWGLGYRKMLRAAFHLRGIVVIRSGRVSMTKTYVGSDVDAGDFSDASSAAFSFDMTDDGSPLIGGTAVSLLFPLEPSAQPRLL